MSFSILDQVFSIKMGNSSSWCGNLSLISSQNVDSHEQSDDQEGNVTAFTIQTNPLSVFIPKSTNMFIKTIGDLQQMSNKKRTKTIQEQIVKRMRNKTIKMKLNITQEQAMKLVLDEIQLIIEQKSAQGKQVTFDMIDRQKVFKQLKINFYNFIKINGSDITQYYSFKQCIGEGSYGKVFRAICKKTKEQRAIKVLKKKINKEQKNTFLAQIHLLSELDHPNIIKLYEIYYFRDIYYVVMEYCKGGSLIDFAKKIKKINEEILASIMKQLLSALAYLHKQGIVHRDIKLENIVFLEIVHKNNVKDYLHIKIIDFGTAIKLKKDKKIVGTRFYMAPEVFRGVINEKSDIWSCGIFLYTIISGNFPFRGGNNDELRTNIESKPLIYTQKPWKSISKDAKMLIMALLDKNIDRRPTASEALNFSWFKLANKSDLVVHFEDLHSLDRYQRGNNLISVIESYISLLKISQNQRTKLGILFNQIDKNKDGSIEYAELMDVYQSQFGVHTESEITNILKMIDKNQSGKIDFNEFLTAMHSRKKLFLEEFLAEAFNHFDVDKDGYLQKVQLKEILKGCQRQQLQYIFDDLDTNNDDKVSLRQFIDYMRKFD